MTLEQLALQLTQEQQEALDAHCGLASLKDTKEILLSILSKMPKYSKGKKIIGSKILEVESEIERWCIAYKKQLT